MCQEHLLWPGLDLKDWRILRMTNRVLTLLSLWLWHYIDNPPENNGVIHRGGQWPCIPRILERKWVSRESNKPYCHLLLYKPDKIELCKEEVEAGLLVVIRFRIYSSTKFLQEIINCSNEPPAWPSDADKVGSGDSEQIFLCPAQQSTLGGQLQRCSIENIYFKEWNEKHFVLGCYKK